MPLDLFWMLLIVLWNLLTKIILSSYPVLTQHFNELRTVKHRSDFELSPAQECHVSGWGQRMASKSRTLSCLLQC